MLATRPRARARYSDLMQIVRAARCGMMSGWVRSLRRKVKTGTDSNPPLGAGNADTIPDNGAEGARATLSIATAAAINSSGELSSRERSRRTS